MENKNWNEINATGRLRTQNRRRWSIRRRLRCQNRKRVWNGIGDRWWWWWWWERDKRWSKKRRAHWIQYFEMKNRRENPDNEHKFRWYVLICAHGTHKICIVINLCKIWTWHEASWFSLARHSFRSPTVSQPLRTLGPPQNIQSLENVDLRLVGVQLRGWLADWMTRCRWRGGGCCSG